MKLSELHKRIAAHVEDMQPYQDLDVVISIKLPYATMGAQPTVKVKNVWNGFDWDDGKFIIVPEESLTKPNDEFTKQFKDMQDRYGRLYSENNDLKSEIKKLKKLLNTK